MVQEGGYDPLSGGWQRDTNGEDLCEEFDLRSLDPRLRARFERQKEEETRLTREQREDLQRILPVGAVFLDEPMKDRCGIATGGPAEAFVVADDLEALKRLVGWATGRGVDYVFWGEGTSSFVRDNGVRGIVVKLGKNFDFIKRDRESEGEIFVSAGGATTIDSLTQWSAAEGASGIELMAGAGGTVGGRLIANAGADAGEFSGAIEEVTIVNREGRELTLKKTALRFEAADLKLPRTAAVVRVLLRLKKEEPASVSEHISSVLRKRMETEPVGVPCIGCVFRRTGKTEASILIEDAGLEGVRVGGARVSAVNANFILNEGPAKARDVVVLMNLVRERVREQTGLTLEPAVVVIGDK